MFINESTKIPRATKAKRTRRSRPKGQMIERTPGVWLLCVSAGFDGGGKRRRFYRTVLGDCDEADAALSDFKRELEDGILANGRTKTLTQYVSHWLDDKAHEVAPSTLRRYRADIERFVIPSLGAIRLADLKPRDLKQAYSSWQKTRRDGRKGQLSSQTVLHAHRVLHHALAVAVRYGDIARNPADAVTLPKATKREMRFFNEQDAGALLNAAQGTSMEVPIMLGLGCGLRRNEILGLRWRDVNLDRQLLTVAQSMDFERSAGFRFKRPKNEKARAVRLCLLVSESLRRHRASQNHKRLKKGPAYKSTFDLVVCEDDGSPMNPNAFASAFRQIVKKAGLADCGPHTMRHTWATLALAGGCDALSVSRALGHFDPGFTLRQYGHVLPSMQEQTAAMVDATLRRAQLESAQDRLSNRTNSTAEGKLVEAPGDKIGDKTA